MKISPQHFKQIIREELTKFLLEGKKEKKNYSIVDYGKPYKPPNHPDRTFHKRGQTSAGSYSEFKPTLTIGRHTPRNTLTTMKKIISKASRSQNKLKGSK